KSSFAAV
ncbi:hypothetical protein VCHENC02_2373, partial [Vibrio harveyi]